MRILLVGVILRFTFLVDSRAISKADLQSHIIGLDQSHKDRRLEISATLFTSPILQECITSTSNVDETPCQTFPSKDLKKCKMSKISKKKIKIGMLQNFSKKFEKRNKFYLL